MIFMLPTRTVNLFGKLCGYLAHHNWISFCDGRVEALYNLFIQESRFLREK